MMLRQTILTALMLAALTLTRDLPAQPGVFVRVKVDTANVREGPGTQFGRAWQVYENEPLRVVARQGEWLETRDFQGSEGWIHAGLTDDRPAVVVKARLANIRSGPGVEHPVVFTAERGVPFRLHGTRGEWLSVEHADGDRGWVHATLVWGRW
jgi:SH3-like domain-containing protein